MLLSKREIEERLVQVDALCDYDHDPALTLPLREALETAQQLAAWVEQLWDTDGTRCGEPFDATDEACQGCYWHEVCQWLEER